MNAPKNDTNSLHIDGTRITFVRESRERPSLVGDFNGWGILEAPLSMQQIADGRWRAELDMPIDAYFEYAFLVNGMRLPDPTNPLIVHDGFGNTNSALWMPDAHDTELARPTDLDVPHGTVSTHTITSSRLLIDGERRFHLYQPPIAEPVPLVVVFDGGDYLQKAGLAHIVDNLIAQQRIQPIALALIDSSDKGRTVEYACSDTTVAFVVHQLLPFAREHLILSDPGTQPGAYGLLGASMGGLMSTYTAMRAPEIFGKVLCQSGAFGAHSSEYRLYYRSVLEDLIRYMPRPPIRLWLDCGLHEWFIAPNRVMVALLKAHGYDVTYREHSSGHNYPSWRNSVWRGLEYLYGSQVS